PGTTLQRRLRIVDSCGDVFSDGGANPPASTKSSSSFNDIPESVRDERASRGVPVGSKGFSWVPEGSSRFRVHRRTRPAEPGTTWNPLEPSRTCWNPLEPPAKRA